ncbi:MAG: hypothetical protein AB1393_07670 [Candidatus Edwardsbacteria bacterium]
MENIDDFFKPISRETIFKKPKSVKDQGFTSKKTTMKETDEGIERFVEESLIVSACGEVIRENEIGGRCDVCGNYTCREHTFHCYACKKTLCLRHVHFLKEGDKEYPYCLECYKIAIDNYDTWKDFKKLKQ